MKSVTIADPFEELYLRDPLQIKPGDPLPSEQLTGISRCQGLLGKGAFIVGDEGEDRFTM